MRKSAHRFIFTVLFILVSRTQAAPKNVLFIVIDDLKPWLGCYGHPVIQTPNIDRIAEQGTVFRRNYCQVALCGPTRMSLMTGLRPDTTQVYNMGGEIYHIDTARKRAPHLRTLPEHLKANGYTCVGFGKVLDGRNTGAGQDRQSWSNPQGVLWQWDQSLWPESPARGGYQNPETRKRIDDALAEAKRRKMTNKRKINDFLSSVEGTRPVCECLDVPDEAYPEGNVMAAPAINAIRRLSSNEKPFFLAVGFYKPHLPFNAPKKYWDLYKPEDFDVAPVQQWPEGSPAMAATDYNEGRGFHPVPAQGPIPEVLQRHMMHGYAACISYVDAQVGKLFQALEKEDLLDDTVICIWGDHGFHLGDKQVWGKHTNFEQATRTPLIMVSPAIPGNVVTDSLTEFVDVYPTLCELIDVPPPQKLDGRSLVDLMQGKTRDEERPAISQYIRDIDGQHVMGWALRTPRYRYVEWRKISIEGGNFVHSGEVVGVELYDYEKDPHESRNWAIHPEKAETVKRMQEEFDRVLPDLPKRMEML